MFEYFIEKTKNIKSNNVKIVINFRDFVEWVDEMNDMDCLN